MKTYPGSSDGIKDEPPLNPGKQILTSIGNHDSMIILSGMKNLLTPFQNILSIILQNGQKMNSLKDNN